MRSRASFTQEIFSQTTELQVEQITRHLNQTYNYIDANGRVAVSDTPGVRRLKRLFGNPMGAYKVAVMSCLRSFQNTL